MKKSFLTFLSLCLLVLTVSGCHKKQEEAVPPAGEGVETPAEETAPETQTAPETSVAPVE